MAEQNIVSEDSSVLEKQIKPSDNRLLIAGGIFFALVLGVWLWFTPPGLLGKANAVGYAICHRIEARSFAYPNGETFPMCARDTGAYIAVLVGLFVPSLLFRRRHAALFPPVPMMAVMLMMSAAWALDGANSFSMLLPYNIPRLYMTTNIHRLLTGTFHGITLGSLLLPVFNSTIWSDAKAKRTIDGFKELAILYALAAAIIGMTLSSTAIFLYPMAILSAVGTLAILTTITTVIASLIFGRDNQSATLRDALPLLLFGASFTLMLIGGIDAVRFLAFGTWDGFIIP